MRRLIACFFLTDVALAAMYLVFFLIGNPLGNDRPGMFDMNGEGNIPSWYSAMKLLAVAICAYFYGRLVLLDDALAGWLILLGAALFIFLSMDEGATLHEKIGDRFNMLVSGTGDLTAKPILERTGLWMVFLGPPLLIGLISGVAFLRKRLAIPTNIFVKAIAGIVIFVVAAAPGDIAYNYVSGNIETIQIAIEEFSEMIGVTLILWAVMSLLADKRAAVVAGALAETAPPQPLSATTLSKFLSPEVQAAAKAPKLVEDQRHPSYGGPLVPSHPGHR